MSDSPRQGRRALWSWAMFDFANSPFTTLVVTFVYPTYFVKAIAPDPVVGTALWSRAVAASAIVVALFSPLAGAVADRGGLRRPLLAISVGVNAVATLALAVVLPGQVLPALVGFAVANVAFEMGMVFYNSYLPDIAPPERMGHASGFAWGLGYFGGLLALLIALVGLVQPETPWFGLSRDQGQNIRATNVLVALWLMVFAPFTLFGVPERHRPRAPVASAVRQGYAEIIATLRSVRQYRQVVRFLLAFMLYNDALITVFAFGGIYATGTFGFTFTEILVFGIVLNVCAGLGAMVFGRLDDRWGSRHTVMLAVGVLTAATLLAVVAPSRPWFWAAGILLGIFAGPAQAAGRTLMARLAPPERHNEFFGFFALSGKATSFIGPAALGLLTQTFDSQRVGVAAIAVMFVAGLAVLRGVQEPART